MGDVTFVKVVQCYEELLNDSLCLLLWEKTLRLSFKVRIQALTLHILHHEVDVLRCVDCFE